MRGRRELRGRFWGTLLIALGATVIAGFGSAFAALGRLVPFSVALLVGISVMFAGFLRATRSAPPQPR
jgi:lipopolysaccharide export LptBFGC system permease protein LptF